MDHTTDSVVPPPPGPVLNRAERRLKASTDALRTLLRDMYADRFGSPKPGLDDVPLQLRLRARPNEDWALEFDPPLVDQLSVQFEDAQATLDVYRRGHVYCFRCDSSECEHSAPATALSVFAGYDSTGHPVWTELTQALIDMKHARVDQLFARPPRAVAALQFGHQLRGDQLATFGRSSKTYAVLGQVIAGYYGCPPDAAARVAISFQIVEARGESGRIRLHVNTIARMPDGGAIDDALGAGWEPSIFRARAVASRALESLELQVRAARDAGRSDDARDLMRRVPVILRRLCEHLERGDRQVQRRTRHVEDRREDRRPVHKAVEDAKDASAAAVFFDEKAATFVVHGAKGRAHAFSKSGRHVTSFVVKPDGLDHRLRSRRWRPISTDEFQDFKASINATP